MDDATRNRKLHSIRERTTLHSVRNYDGCGAKETQARAVEDLTLSIIARNLVYPLPILLRRDCISYTRETR